MEEESKSFKVLDKRRIDEHGEERSAESSPKADAATKSEGVKSAVSSSDEVEVREDLREINFSSFIMSLATQALMQLGQVKPPPGVDLAIDPLAARQTIDIIGMLGEKTKGNLDKEEQHLIDEILNSLRFQFLQKAGK